MKSTVCLFLFLTIALSFPAKAQAVQQGLPELNLLPYPREVQADGEGFDFGNPLRIVTDHNAAPEDLFTAAELARQLKNKFMIEAIMENEPTGRSIVLTRKGAEKRIGQEGYQLSAKPGRLVIRAQSAAGLFYGTQTLLQLIQPDSRGYSIPGLKITDWPSVKQRAVHYDTKHHQDKKEYVEAFIRDLARWKINMLVWEWEDKFAYPTHPEIGAPGRFTVAEIQHFTAYAKQYHVQLVPLVQGLGHVSFILKWPQYAPLREIASSNWEFCPLKEDTYKLLFDLWDDALKATPGSEYIHIGSDETYELGSCPACKAKAAEIGKSGLYLLFVNRAAEHFKSKGRQVMVWEPPMGWEKNQSPAIGIHPVKGLVLTESYEYENPDFSYARKAKSLGFKVFGYDPNPGIEHLFLPYFYKEDDAGKRIPGSLETSHRFLTSFSKSGIEDGVISTSWDDSGLHYQAWMMRFAAAATWSWNAQLPTLEAFPETFFNVYYGPKASDMKELFGLLNEGAYYYMSTFERKVWHWGQIGKTQLPDLPRGDALEFDPFWNKRYAEMIQSSASMLEKMKRAGVIIDQNQIMDVNHREDFEIFRTITLLISHTANTCAALSTLENLISQANKVHFDDHALAYVQLEKACTLIENNLKERKVVFDGLVATWERTRLPKGWSTDTNKYFFQQDRARHFANRRPDMSYLIYDEQKLGLEEYLQKLLEYKAYYKKTFL